MKKKRVCFIELCEMIREEKQPETILFDGYTFEWVGEEYYSEEYGAYLTGMDSLESLINRCQFEYQDPLLDDAERKYLRNVILPFYEDVIYIYKVGFNNKEAIYVETPGSVMKFPSFPSGKMYKGMKSGKYYKLKELGIEK